MLLPFVCLLLEGENLKFYPQNFLRTRESNGHTGRTRQKPCKSCIAHDVTVADTLKTALYERKNSS